MVSMRFYSFYYSSSIRASILHRLIEFLFVYSVYCNLYGSLYFISFHFLLLLLFFILSFKLVATSHIFRSFPLPSPRSLPSQHLRTDHAKLKASDGINGGWLVRMCGWFHPHSVVQFINAKVLQKKNKKLNLNMFESQQLTRANVNFIVLMYFVLAHFALSWNQRPSPKHNFGRKLHFESCFQSSDWTKKRQKIII